MKGLKKTAGLILASIGGVFVGGAVILVILQILTFMFNDPIKQGLM